MNTITIRNLITIAKIQTTNNPSHPKKNRSLSLLGSPWQERHSLHVLFKSYVVQLVDLMSLIKNRNPHSAVVMTVWPGVVFSQIGPIIWFDVIREPHPPFIVICKPTGWFKSCALKYSLQVIQPTFWEGKPVSQHYQRFFSYWTLLLGVSEHITLIILVKT